MDPVVQRPVGPVPHREVEPPLEMERTCNVLPLGRVPPIPRPSGRWPTRGRKELAAALRLPVTGNRPRGAPHETPRRGPRRWPAAAPSTPTTARRQGRRRHSTSSSPSPGEPGITLTASIDRPLTETAPVACVVAVRDRPLKSAGRSPPGCSPAAPPSSSSSPALPATGRQQRRPWSSAGQMVGWPPTTFAAHRTASPRDRDIDPKRNGALGRKADDAPALYAAALDERIAGATLSAALHLCVAKPIRIPSGPLCPACCDTRTSRDVAALIGQRIPHPLDPVGPDLKLLPPTASPPASPPLAAPTARTAPSSSSTANCRPVPPRRDTRLDKVSGAVPGPFSGHPSAGGCGGHGFGEPKADSA